MTKIELISCQMQEDGVCCSVGSADTQSDFLNNIVPSKKTQVVAAWHQSRLRQSGQDGRKNKKQHRFTITGSAKGWGTAAPLVRIWQKRARIRWAWLQRWPACSPSRSDSRQRSKCQRFRSRTWPGMSWGRKGRRGVQQPWWTLHGGDSKRAGYKAMLPSAQLVKTFSSILTTKLKSLFLHGQHWRNLTGLITLKVMQI